MDKLFGRRFVWTFGSIVICGTALLGFIFYQLAMASRESAAQVRLAVERASLDRQSVTVYSQFTLRPGTTFSDALEHLQVEPAEAQEIVRSAGSVFDLRQVRSGGEIELGRSVEGKLQEVR